MAEIVVNGREVVVSDNFLSMSPDQQNATVDEIAKNMPSVWGGRLKQAGVALAKGAIGLPGMVGDIGHFVDLGFNKIEQLRGVPEEETQKKRDMARNFLDPPTSHYLQSQVEKVTGEFRKPQTTEEKYIDTVGQFIPATIGPGGLVRTGINALKYGVAPGIASEFAGQQVEGTKAEPWVRAGTALATGAGVAGASGLVTRPSAAQRTIKGAIPDSVTTQHLDAAEQLFQESLGSLYKGQFTHGQTRNIMIGNQQNLANIKHTVADPIERVRNPDMVAHLESQIPSLEAEIAAAEKFLTESSFSWRPQPITRAEALNHVTQGGTNLGNVQRVIEGQGELRPMMAERAAANDAAAQPMLHEIAPRTVEPSMIGPDIGEAATNTIQGMESARTRATKPFYDAANTDKVPAKEMRDFVKEIDKQIKADKTGIIGDALQEVRDLLTKQKRQPGKPAEVILHDASVPEPFATANPVKEVIPAVKRKNELIHTDIESLDRIRKYVRDKLDLPQIGADAITKEQGAGVTRLLDNLRQKMIDASPNFQQGKQLHEDITKRFLNPIMAGPLGKLAAKDVTTRNAIEALFPTNPLAGSAEEITTAVGALAKRNPEAAKRLVRAHVEMTFNEATQNLIKGANEFGGAKFAAVIRGNPQQAANLEAAVRALPGGDQIYQGFDRFLNFVEAQGQRQAIGSQTAFNQEVLADLRRGTPIQEAGNAVLTGGLKLPARVKETLDRWRLGRGTEDIAHLLVDPASGGKFRAIAQMPPGSEQARRVMLRLVLIGAQGLRSGTE